MANVGLSFAPTNQGSAPSNQSPPVNPVQEAVRILSFRQPTTLGANAPVAQSLYSGGQPSLMGAQMGMGSPVEQLLRMLFGGMGTGQGATTGVAGPLPSVDVGNQPAPTPPTGTPLPGIDFRGNRPTPTPQPGAGSTAPTQGGGFGGGGMGRPF